MNTVNARVVLTDVLMIKNGDEPQNVGEELSDLRSEVGRLSKALAEAQELMNWMADKMEQTEKDTK